MRVQEKTAELELLCERLMIQAYEVRDEPDWKTLAALLSEIAQLASYLRDQDGALLWTDQHLTR